MATTASPTREALSETDRAALELAIEIARKQDRGRREQIDDKLRREPWLEVGIFAAYCCQDRALRLKPWQLAPCMVEADATDAPGHEPRGARNAAALLRRMLSLNISRFHPDPVAAINAAEQARRDMRVGDGQDSTSAAPPP